MEPICALKDIYKALYQFEKDFSDTHLLTINEAMLLCCLKEGEARTAGTICEYIGLSNSRVSKVITAVENKGFIRRAVSKEDKRQMLFTLTPKGKEKVQQMMTANLNIEALYTQLAISIGKE
ncbi:MAG: winged helix DNA-binding protein [Tannerellaceae bacterium]